MGLLTRIFRSRDAPKNATAGSGYSFMLGSSASGKAVNERSAMQITAVYSCVRILSEAIASLPLHLYKYTDTGTAKATDHLLYFLLHDEPNPEMTSFVFRETLMTHLLLWGNAYAQIIHNGKGEVLALYPLMPDRMNVDRDESGEIVYEYMVSQEDAPINSGAIATEEYGSKFFANGATPSGILEFPGTVKEPERVRESWNKGFGGENKHKVAILEQGVRPDGRH